MQKQGKSTRKTRCNLSLCTQTVQRIDALASTYSISRTAAFEQLIQLGLDADEAGIDTSIAIQSKIKNELNGLRGLIAAAIDAADTASSTALLLAFQTGQIEADAIANTYTKARRYTKENIKQLKKND